MALAALVSPSALAFVGAAQLKRPLPPSPRRRRPATAKPAPTPEPPPPAEAVLETDAGPITIKLLADLAPRHVRFFAKTARAGGFDGTTFHRVIAGGIIQGGDPLSQGPEAVRPLRHRAAWACSRRSSPTGP